MAVDSALENPNYSTTFAKSRMHLPNLLGQYSVDAFDIGIKDVSWSFLLKLVTSDPSGNSKLKDRRDPSNVYSVANVEFTEDLQAIVFVPTTRPVNQEVFPLYPIVDDSDTLYGPFSLNANWLSMNGAPDTSDNNPLYDRLISNLDADVDKTSIVSQIQRDDQYYNFLKNLKGNVLYHPPNFTDLSNGIVNTTYDFSNIAQGTHKVIIKQFGAGLSMIEDTTRCDEYAQLASQGFIVVVVVPPQNHFYKTMNIANYKDPFSFIIDPSNCNKPLYDHYDVSFEKCNIRIQDSSTNKWYDTYSSRTNVSPTSPTSPYYNNNMSNSSITNVEIYFPKNCDFSQTFVGDATQIERISNESFYDISYSLSFYEKQLYLVKQQLENLKKKLNQSDISLCNSLDFSANKIGYIGSSSSAMLFGILHNISSTGMSKSFQVDGSYVMLFKLATAFVRRGVINSPSYSSPNNQNIPCFWWKDNLYPSLGLTIPVAFAIDGTFNNTRYIQPLRMLMINTSAEVVANSIVITQVNDKQDPNGILKATNYISDGYYPNGYNYPHVSNRESDYSQCDWLNTTNYTDQEVLIEHALKIVKIQVLWFKRNLMSSSQQTTLKQIYNVGLPMQIGSDYISGSAELYNQVNLGPISITYDSISNTMNYKNNYTGSLTKFQLT